MPDTCSICGATEPPVSGFLDMMQSGFYYCSECEANYCADCAGATTSKGGASGVGVMSRSCPVCTGRHVPKKSLWKRLFGDD